MNAARVDPRTHRRSLTARRVRDLLRAAIIHEEFAVGPLPGEAALMLAFSTSRQVVRDALALLRDEGLIDRMPGSGTFVVASKVRHRLTHLHGPEPIQSEIRYRILSDAVEPAAPRVADRLGIAAGAPCGVIEYLGALDAEPYQLVTTYVPLDVHALVAEAREFPDWYGLLEAAGHEFGTTEQAIEAISADEHVARLLEVAPGAPLLLFERQIGDRDGRTLDYAFARVRGDRLALMTRLPRSGAPEEI